MAADERFKKKSEQVRILLDDLKKLSRYDNSIVPTLQMIDGIKDAYNREERQALSRTFHKEGGVELYMKILTSLSPDGSNIPDSLQRPMEWSTRNVLAYVQMYSDPMQALVDCGGIKYLLGLLKHHACQGLMLRFESKNTLRYAVSILANLTMEPELKSCFHQERAVDVLACYLDVPDAPCKLSALHNLARVATEQDLDIICNAQGAISLLTDMVNRPSHKNFTALENIVYPAVELVKILTLVSITAGIRRKMLKPGAELEEEALQEILPEVDSIVQSVMDSSTGETKVVVHGAHHTSPSWAMPASRDYTLEWGDIAVHPTRRSVQKWPKARDGRIYIPYKVSLAFYDSDVKKIEEAALEFEKKTCVRFILRSGETDYIYIHAWDGNWSFLGRQGGDQALSLEPGKVTKGVVLHEFMHALGFHHEHCRSDRDDHVWVLSDNIDPEWKDAIERKTSQVHTTPYDYSSITHYSTMAGSRDGQSPTMLPKDKSSTRRFGGGHSLSDGDVEKIKEMFERAPATAPPSRAASQPGSSTGAGAGAGTTHRDAGACTKEDAMRLFNKLPQEVKGSSMRGAPSPCGVKDGISAGRVGRWPQGPGGQVCVPYKLSAAFYDYDVEAVVQATQEFEKKTCVRFQPHAGETDFIHIQDLGGKSWSLPGKQGGEQPLSLEPGKVTKGIVLHELMHALGFQHEHCRSDRDDHVWVVPENVKKEWKEQIVDINSNEQDLVAPYDCSSIMHYSMLAGSVDERNPTIIPRDVLCMLHMGQSNSLSPCDVVKVQKLYGYEAEVHAASAAVARRSRTSADEDAPLDSNVGVWKAKTKEEVDEEAKKKGLEWKEKTDPLRNLIKELMEIRWYDSSSLPRLQSLLNMLSAECVEDREKLLNVFKQEGGPTLLQKMIESCRLDKSRVQIITLRNKITLLLSEHELFEVGKQFEKTGDIAGDPSDEIKLWPEQSGKVYIPYSVSIAFNASDKEAIQQACDELTEKTCVRLIPKDPQEDYFYFRALGRDSSSLLGARAGEASRSIALELSEVEKGAVLHKLMHVFGFHRDQQNGSHDWVKHRDGKVYVLYDVCSGFDTNDKENIQKAVNEFAEKTCVRLIRKDNQEDYINFQALDGGTHIGNGKFKLRKAYARYFLRGVFRSWSFLGKKGGAQSLSLEPRKVTKGVVLHELMHALGFHHEHCRSDRDQHIKVHEDNVKEDELGQFKRLECNGCGEDLPYDYLSIMHYGRYASSSDYMSETITPTTAAKAPIGQRSGLSPLDVLRVQLKYQPNLAGVSEDKALKVALAKTAALCETLQEPPRPIQDLAVQAEMIEQMLTHHWQGLQLEQMEAMKK